MKKILIIEDQPVMRANVAELLELEGYTALQAEDGQVGLTIAHSERPDLVLCDIMMPGLDGLGVLQAMRSDANLKHVPFIFLTARGERVDLRNGMNLGADDYLIKPVDRKDLLAAVESRLRRQQLKAAERADFDNGAPL
jgi:DNA-binding response OmpR family regulator